MLRWALALALCTACACAEKQKKKDSDCRAIPGKSQKPLMVIHHKEDCQFCRALKKAFALEKSIQKMAKQDFIMLNLVEETSEQNLAPDGYYVPRILFIDPSMIVRADIKGKYSNHQYTYEPGDMADLLENMKKAKALLRTEL